MENKIEKEKLHQIKSCTPLFITGCQRSGTSFLYRVLSEMLDIGFGRDNTLFLNIFRTIDQYGDLSIDENFHKLLRNISDSPVFQKRFKKLPITENSFINCIEKREYSDLVRSIYAYWALTKGKSMWGGKTPDYTAQLDLLCKLFPDVQVINIIRDGRDVALSLLGTPWGPKDIYVAAKYWKKRIQEGENGKLSLRNNYLEITYEDFLKKPEEIFTKILNFLETDESEKDAILAKFRKAILPKIIPGNTFKWKNNLSSKDNYIFEIVAGEELEKFNYEIVNKDYASTEISTFSKGYHYWKNFYVKAKKGHILRTIMLRTWHYKYK